MRFSRSLYFALGFLCAAAMPAAAERIVTECRQVIKPDPAPCDLGLFFKNGYMPDRCRIS